MAVPTGLARRALVTFSAMALLYFGALLAVSLVDIRLLSLDSRTLQIAFILFGLPVAITNGLVIWRWSHLVAGELAFRDDLTGLPNRRAFTAQAAAALRSSKPGSLALVLFDIDGLKRLNDTCGHQAGDELIRTAARGLTRAASRATPVFRIGGDEFALILDRAQGGRVSRLIQVLKTFETRFASCGHTHEVAISFGVASCGEGDTFETLFKRADQRLYERKDRAYSSRRAARLVANGGEVTDFTAPRLELVHSQKN